MATDTRRIVGPENTQNPYLYRINKTIPDILDNGQRKDGRKMDQPRPMYLKPGAVSQAKGSAYVELKNTKVICAVYGPREVLRREDFSMKCQLTCDFKFATFSCQKRRQYQADREEKDLSKKLCGALLPAVRLEKFPKSQVNVYVTVLQNDGGALAAAITCASLALADGGFEMYDLVVGSSIRIHGDKLLVDPTEEEESVEVEGLNEGTVVVGLMPSLHQMSALASSGAVEFDIQKQAVKTCIATCQKVYPVLQKALIDSVKDELKQSDKKMAS